MAINNPTPEFFYTQKKPIWDSKESIVNLKDVILPNKSAAIQFVKSVNNEEKKSSRRQLFELWYMNSCSLISSSIKNWAIFQNQKHSTFFFSIENNSKL